MKIVVNAIAWIMLIVALVIILTPSSLRLSSDYSREIVVDDSSKVELAISNAVNDVSSRGFIVNDITVQRYWIGKTFRIRCGGIERSNLLKN